MMKFLKYFFIVLATFVLVKCISPKKTDYQVYTCFTSQAVTNMHNIDYNTPRKKTTFKMLKYTTAQKKGVLHE